MFDRRLSYYHAARKALSFSKMLCYESAEQNKQRCRKVFVSFKVEPSMHYLIFFKNIQSSLKELIYISSVISSSAHSNGSLY